MESDNLPLSGSQPWLPVHNVMCQVGLTPGLQEACSQVHKVMERAMAAQSLEEELLHGLQVQKHDQS